jgi:nuclear transport factor 2 (NTF2) superfamily protein
MNVNVGGELNGWNTQSLSMRKNKDGVWRSKIKLLLGRYEHKLFFDKIWLGNLPDAGTVSNPFGTRNFVISVK